MAGTGGHYRQLEWREVFEDLNHHGVYHSGEVVGLGSSGVRSVTIIWRFTRRMCCRFLSKCGATRVSAGRFTVRKVHYRGGRLPSAMLSDAVGLPVAGSLRRRSILPVGCAFEPVKRLL